MIIIYTVFANADEAKKITKILLEKKLVVCGNMFEMNSMYLWKGKIEEGKEIGCFYKTFKQNYNRVKAEIESLHSYEAPPVISLKASNVNGVYYHALKKEVRKYYGKKSPEAKPNLKNPDISKKSS